MSLTAEMIDAMVAAGLSRDQMAVLLKAGLADAEREKAEKRARAAAKKRRQRAELALEPFDVPECPGDIEGQKGTKGDIGGQTGTGGDIDADAAKKAPCTPIETTPSEDTPSDPKGSSAPKGADRRRGTRIPDDFERTTEARAVTAAFGLVGDAADEALAEFCDYWRALPGLKATKLDWPATLRNRLREVIRRKPPRPPRGPPPGRRSTNGPLSLLASLNGADHDPSGSFHDDCTLDHDPADGRSHRAAHEPDGGPSGHAGPEGRFRLVRTG